jgi:glutamate-1-semialdehyde 2,1-aminomutase
MMSIRFRKEPVKNYQDALKAAGGERYGVLFRHLLEAGIYWPPADLEAFFVSHMHTKKDLSQLAKTLKEFFGAHDRPTQE